MAALITTQEMTGYVIWFYELLSRNRCFFLWSSLLFFSVRLFCFLTTAASLFGGHGKCSTFLSPSVDIQHKPLIYPEYSHYEEREEASWWLLLSWWTSLACMRPTRLDGSVTDRPTFSWLKKKYMFRLRIWVATRISMAYCSGEGGGLVRVS
jgi:hypothetical protein